MRKSRTYGSVRGWHREVPVYSTVGIDILENIVKTAHLRG